MVLRPGEPFDRYRIESVLGEGGMGQVYRAIDTRLRRAVALKVIAASDGGALSTEGAARLLREARAAASIDHPNAVSIFDVGEVDGTPFLAMELVEGRTLRSFVGDASVPTATRLAWLAQVARALAAAHRRGIVHRDVKPENVMVRHDGVVKVVDFGIARAVRGPEDEIDSGGAAPLTTLTGDGVAIGTPLYMSPEQLKQEPIDGRSDQFAWGVLAYELLAGRTPWPAAQGAVHVLSHILSVEPPALASLAPEVSPDVAAIVARALRKAPADRFAPTDALVSAFESAAAIAVTPAPQQLGTMVSPFAQTAAHGTPAAEPRSLEGARFAPASHPRRAWRVRALAVGSAAVVLAGVAFGARWLTSRDATPGGTFGGAASPSTGRRTAVALVDFRPLADDKDTAWLGTALAEMLATELATGEQLRVVARERVDRAARESSAGAAAVDLPRVARATGADYVVTGAFVTVGGAGRRVRVDVAVHPADGAEPARFAITGDGGELFDVVTRTGAEVRRRLGTSSLSPEESAATRAALPSTPAAARAYAEGLALMRRYDFVAAKTALERAVAEEPGYAMGHATLSRAWSSLGYDAKAAEEAQAALARSDKLSREQRLAIEAQLETTKHEWAAASEHYRTLFGFFPDNLDYGLRYVLAQVHAGKRREAFDTLAEIRKQPLGEADALRVDLQEAFVAAKTADYPRRLRVGDDVARRAKAAGSVGVLAEARRHTGEAHEDLGDFAAAQRDYEEARDILERVGELDALAVVQRQLARLHGRRGDHERAERLTLDALAVTKRTGNQYQLGGMITAVAIERVYIGRLREARASFDEARALFEAIHDKEGIAHNTSNAAVTMLDMGEIDAARPRFEEAHALHAEIGQRFGIEETRFFLADVAYRRGDLGEARKMFDEVLDLANKLASKEAVADVRARQGDLARDLDDLPAARKAYDEARATYAELGDPMTTSRTDTSLAFLALDEGRRDDALRLAQQAVDMATTRDEKAQALAALAIAHARARQPKEAADAEARAAPLALASERPFVRAVVALATAEVRALEGRADDVRAALATARSAARASGSPRYALEVELVAGSIGRASHAADAASVLAAVERDARARGFARVARMAAASRR